MTIYPITGWTAVAACAMAFAGAFCIGLCAILLPQLWNKEKRKKHGFKDGKGPAERRDPGLDYQEQFIDPLR